jgi:flagellar basal-body rod modification protein FlgD
METKMAVTSTSTMTSASAYAGTSAADKASNKYLSDMNTFLTMLTSQLQNQDPLSPMDSTEFTNQLVMFSQVEQTIQTNSNLEDLNDMTFSSMNMSAVGYIGKTIQAEGSTFSLEDSKAKFAYLLSDDAESVGIAIQNEDGETVKTIIGEIKAGNHEYEWDGTDNDGNVLEDGTYSFSVTPISGEEGVEIDVYSTIFGKVDGVASDTSTGSMYASIGDSVVSISNILTVRDGI